VLAADLRDRPIPAKRGQHQLDLLLRRELPVLALVAQRDLLLVERPILRGAPDAISASPYGLGSDHVRTPQPVNALPGSRPANQPFSVNGDPEATTSTRPAGTLTLDTHPLSSGDHTLQLTAHLTNGKTLTVTNTNLRIDHTPPTGELADPGRFVTGTINVTGTMEDAHRGPKDWRVERSPQGQGAWGEVCRADAPGPYLCRWDTTQSPDGPYHLRATKTDLMLDKHPNVAFAEVTTTVDNTDPSLELSGLAHDATDGRPLHDGNQYDLNISAQDGGSGVRSLDVLVDGVKKGSWEQECSNGGCPLSRTFLFAPDDYAEGPRQIEVATVDGVGRRRSAQWTVYVEKIAPEPSEEEEQASASPSSTTSGLGLPGTEPRTMATPELKALAGVDPLVRFSAANADTYLLPCTSSEAPANFPVWSLGPSFEGLDLKRVVRRCDQPSPMEPIRSNWVTYVYGDCPEPIDDPERDGCVPPLQVQSWPACETSLWSFELGPEEFRITYVEGQLRGAPAAVFGDDGLRVEIYTGISTVVIYGTDRDQILRAVSALREHPGAGTLAGLSPILPGGTLPPPAEGAIRGALACV
jgi:hypothetical protein